MVNDRGRRGEVWGEEGGVDRPWSTDRMNINKSPAHTHTHSAGFASSMSAPYIYLWLLDHNKRCMRTREIPCMHNTSCTTHAQHTLSIHDAHLLEHVMRRLLLTVVSDENLCDLASVLHRCLQCVCVCVCACAAKANQTLKRRRRRRGWGGVGCPLLCLVSFAYRRVRNVHHRPPPRRIGS